MTFQSEKTKKKEALDCPCQSGFKYEKCCELLHKGGKSKLAESIMRSRYSAFVLDIPQYLLETWHSTTRPETIENDPAIKWFSLRLLSSEERNVFGEQYVTFEARFRENGKAYKFKERSRFIEEAGRLVYIDGEFLS